MIRVDLHSHTHYSPDSMNSPSELVRRARHAGLHRLAVTDHGVFEGALAAHRIDPELVILGEEMKCACGTHLIGLFLKEGIPNRLSVAETARRIRSQGGVVYAPHPYAYLTRVRTRAQRALEVADVVEGFNARAFIPSWNRRALAVASERGLPAVVGSDAHFPWEIGRAYTEMPAFSDAASFRSALAQARTGATDVMTPLVHVCSIGIEGVRTALGRRRRKN